jgi:hypothetical protein
LKTTWVKYFSNPIVGIIGTIASILGLVLAIYFYMSGRILPLLTSSVNPVRTTIVKRGQISTLAVLQNGVTLTTDVTAVQIAFWNAGKKEIRDADILEPFFINLDCPILEASVTKKSRDLIDFEIDQSKIAKGQIGIRWRILEENDGVVIQLIYAGDQSCKVSTRGVIVGQRQIKVLDYSDKVVTPSEELENIKKRNILFAGMIFFISFLIFFIGLTYFFSAKQPKKRLIFYFGKVIYINGIVIFSFRHMVLVSRINFCSTFWILNSFNF